MSTLPWFRMYSEFATDPVVQSLSFDDQRHFVMVLCLKCSGLLDKRFPKPEARIEILKRALGLDGVSFVETCNRLVTAGLVSSDWQPLAWKKRQFVSDSSTTRVRAFRKRSRNVTVTPSESDTEQIQIQSKNPPIPPGGTGLDRDAFQRFSEYRSRIGKPIKTASLEAAQKALAKFGPDQAAVVEQSIANSWQGLFALKPHARAAPPPERRWTPSDDGAEAA